jgi:Rieske Fe-S protein
VLQLPVFVLQLPELLYIATFHSSVLRFPAVVGLLANPVLPAERAGRQSCLALLQNCSHLLCRVPFTPLLGVSFPASTCHLSLHDFRDKSVFPGPPAREIP